MEEKERSATPSSCLRFRWLAVDTETTGLDPAIDRVVEVACVWLTPMGYQTALHHLVDPERPIPAVASAIHHWTDAHVRGAPTLAALAPRLAALFARADVLVAHNAPFDRSFLAAVPHDRPWPDTLQLARRLWPDAPGHSNQVLRYWLGLDMTAPDPHNAREDARVTAAILARAFTALPAAAGSTPATLLAWLATLQPATVMPFGRHKGTPLAEVPADYRRWLLGQDLDPDLRAGVRLSLGLSPAS